MPATPGKTYYVDNMSRNAAGTNGRTELFFYDIIGNSLGSGLVWWSTDSWSFNADNTLVDVAPIGTVTLRVRYDLLVPNGTVDMDLLRINESP